jgi:hypothetical protein
MLLFISSTSDGLLMADPALLLLATVSTVHVDYRRKVRTARKSNVAEWQEVSFYPHWGDVFDHNFCNQPEARMVPQPVLKAAVRSSISCGH